MNTKGFFDSFYKVSEWVMKFSVTNIIWLLFNFPIVYFVLSMLLAKSTEQLYMLVIIVIVLLPFIFFPATTALFAVVRRWVMKQDVRLITSYWKYYKENYVRSLLGGIILVIVWLIWVVNYNISGIMIGSGVFYIYAALTIFLIALTNYFFADTVHFEVKLLHSLRKVLIIAFFNAHYTLSAAGVTVFAIFIMYKVHPIIVILFSAPLVAIIYFFAFYQIFLKAKGVKETT